MAATTSTTAISASVLPPTLLPWYVREYTENFKDLLSALLSTYSSQSLVFELKGGNLVEGLLTPFTPGVSITVTFPQFTPRDAACPGVVVVDSKVEIQLSLVAVIRLPSGESVPRALAECARSKRARHSKRSGGEGKLSKGVGGGATRQAAADSAPLGVSWALSEWGLGVETL